jgi:hypothetical protein
MKAKQKPNPALAAVPKAEPQAAPELPEWLQGTSAETTYELTVFDEAGGSVEIVNMNRAEYLALKVRLAELRGISLTQDQVDDLDNTAKYNEDERKHRPAA